MIIAIFNLHFGYAWQHQAIVAGTVYPFHLKPQDSNPGPLARQAVAAASQATSII